MVSHALSFDEAQQTNKLLATSAIEEQVHYTASALATKDLPKPPGKATKPGNRSCFFSVVANNYTLVTCAQGPEKSAASATKPAISQTFVSRPATLQNHPLLLPNPTTPGPRREYFRLRPQENISHVPPEDSIHYENCISLSEKQPPDLISTETIPPSLHPPIEDKSHIVMLEPRLPH